MNRNWIVIGVLAVVLVLMVWTGLRESKQRAGSSSGPVSGEGFAAGQQAPDFELIDVTTHKSVRLSAYRGKAVLLNFWATWCPPCKVEIPWFIDLQKQYGGDGLVVLGVAMDDASDSEIADFAKKMGVNYSILKGTEKVGNAYGGVEGLPTSFYIGRDGKIVSRVPGLRSHGEIEKEVKAALATSTEGNQTAQNESVIPASTVPSNQPGTK